MTQEERNYGPVEGVDRLYEDARPSPALEERVVDDLHGQTKAPRRAAVRALVAVAAASGLFFGGWLLGRASGPPPVPGVPLSGHLFLLWQGQGFDSTHDPAGLVEEYGNWARGARQSGIRLTGTAVDHAHLVGPSEPISSGGAELSGLFLVELSDTAEATRLARTHPHLRHGGWIQLARLR